MLYMITFAINISPMLAYIPYIWDIVAYGFLWFPGQKFSTLTRAGVVPRQRLQDGTLANKGTVHKRLKSPSWPLDIFGRFWDKIGLCCP